MRTFSLSMVVCCLLVGAVGGAEFRTWRLKSGSKAKARIVSMDGEALILESERGKELRVPLDLLSAKDTRYLDKRRLEGELRHSSQTVGVAGSPDRILIPTYNQGEFARGDKNCGPNAFCNFLLWWDRVGVYRIPEGDTERKKAKWLHRELRRHFQATGGTSAAEMKRGIRSFFRKYPSRKYKFVVRVVPFLSLERLQQEARGISATVLGLSSLEGGKLKKKKGHWVSLLTVSDNGAFVLNTWGELYRGQFLVRSKVGTPNGTQAERLALELTPDSNSERFRKNKKQWVIDPANGCCLIVVAPEER